jgi:hypothetical protein
MVLTKTKKLVAKRRYLMTFAKNPSMAKVGLQIFRRKGLEIDKANKTDNFK